MPSVHDFSAVTIDGRDKKLADYTGQVLLLVNVASKCGFTKQYAALEKLHQELETHYFSDLSSANTSAFSYKRPTSAMAKEPRKVVTFPDQSQLSIDST